MGAAGLPYTELGRGHSKQGKPHSTGIPITAKLGLLCTIERNAPVVGGEMESQERELSGVSTQASMDRPSRKGQDP